MIARRGSIDPGVSITASLSVSLPRGRISRFPSRGARSLAPSPISFFLARAPRPCTGWRDGWVQGHSLHPFLRELCSGDGFSFSFFLPSCPEDLYPDPHLSVICHCAQRTHLFISGSSPPPHPPLFIPFKVQLE